MFVALNARGLLQWERSGGKRQKRIIARSSPLRLNRSRLSVTLSLNE
jgi:hypothetical protein